MSGGAGREVNAACVGATDVVTAKSGRISMPSSRTPTLDNCARSAAIGPSQVPLMAQRLVASSAALWQAGAAGAAARR